MHVYTVACLYAITQNLELIVINYKINNTTTTTLMFSLEFQRHAANAETVE